MCGTMMRLDKPEPGTPLNLYCRYCPYVYGFGGGDALGVTAGVERRSQLPLKPKAETAVMAAGGAGMLQKTRTVNCDKCGAADVSFYQLQLRSGDEGSTTFYFCQAKECKHKWQEN